ncbi:hypothetical protein BDZ89DRAFT_1259254 [Hymenopellis radicata]|nr:hypothetical protein BDZ89DRAFT_1259254 [Hymenopellis radicata]
MSSLYSGQGQRRDGTSLFALSRSVWKMAGPEAFREEGHRLGQRSSDPFQYEINEAAEAFFIFETKDDVPDDLITSCRRQRKTTRRPKQIKSSLTFLDLDASSTSDVKQEPQELQGQISQTPKEEDLAERELNERADEVLRTVGCHVNILPFPAISASVYRIELNCSASSPRSSSTCSRRGWGCRTVSLLV